MENNGAENLDTSENTLEIPEKYWNVVLKEDGENQWDQLCETWYITYSQEGKKYLTYNKKEANWIGHILHRNCLLNVPEGKIEWRIEVTGRWGGRHIQLLDDLKETRDSRNWKWKH
jgi:hypothetical protein